MSVLNWMKLSLSPLGGARSHIDRTIHRVPIAAPVSWLTTITNGFIPRYQGIGFQNFKLSWLITRPVKLFFLGTLRCILFKYIHR